MVNRGYAYAIRTMQALEMYQEMYSSSAHYQHHLKDLVATLRSRAETMGKPEERSDKKFLQAFADALEVANQPGEYVSRSQENK
jgi:hypothetical protein